MTLEIREVGMSDDSLSDWLEALSGRFVSTKVKFKLSFCHQGNKRSLEQLCFDESFLAN